MSWYDWFMAFFTTIFIVWASTFIIDRIFGTHISCTLFTGHNGKGTPKGAAFDGCSVHATCTKCGKSVMRDSQGNWF